VHDVGFTAFVLVPVPTWMPPPPPASHSVHNVRLVSGIGIMVELFLASWRCISG